MYRTFFSKFSYHKNGNILKFDSYKKELNFYQIINNICPEVKYGISCFANGVVKTDDLFADDDLIDLNFYYSLEHIQKE